MLGHPVCVPVALTVRAPLHRIRPADSAQRGLLLRFRLPDNVETEQPQGLRGHKLWF